MAGGNVERRLAAILCADVVGYSRLMEGDEEATIRALRACRQNVDELVASHHCRVFGSAGDSVIAEFASAVEAVRCASEIQRYQEAQDADAPEERRMRLRIGINLGDIVVEGGNLLGDGVNVAARLQELAEPGCLCISANIHEQVVGKLDLAFDDLGEKTVKNITRLVRAYRVRFDDSVGANAVPSSEPLPLPDKPSIAVLPFTNMSGDTEQEYFADGITEDIITELSRFRNLKVIARNSSFTFKGQAVNVIEVGRRLNVRYIVEGSVRKSGDRVRVTVQLVETESGSHLWADRYDRILEDIFDLQDEIVGTIAGTIPEQIERIAVDRVRARPPANPTAFDHLLRGRWALHHTTDGLQLAIECLERALEADPNYASAHALMSYAYSYGIYSLDLDPDAAIERSQRHASHAIALDASDAEVNSAAAMCYCLAGKHELADAHSQRAIAANPNDSMALYGRAVVLTWLGRPTEAMELFRSMEAIDPYAPDDVRSEGLGDCLFFLGDYEGQLAIYRRWQQMHAAQLLLQAAAEAQLGRLDDARATLEEFKRRDERKPDPVTFVQFSARMIKRDEDRERWVNAFRKAGLDV